MTTQRPLADEDISAMFHRRARRRLPASLADDIVRATIAVPQRGRRVDGIRRLYSGPTRLLAVALLAVATAAVAVTAGNSWLSRTPAPTAAPTPITTSDETPGQTPAPTLALVDVKGFGHPMTIRLPADEHGVLVGAGRYHIGTTMAGDEGPKPTGHAIDIVALKEIYVHACSGGRKPVRTDPAGFLADLHDVGGLTMTNERAVTISGYAGIAAEINHSGSRCDSDLAPTSDFHLSSGGLSAWVPLNRAGRLILIDAGGETIAIVIWAQGQDELDRWLPTAQAIVDSLTIGPA